MKRYIYNRVSSAAQDYQQQQECIRQYFGRVGIDPGTITEIIVEKISGTVSYEDRKLSELITRCAEGDIIYISELSRLSRSMADLFALVDKCCNKGVTLIQCKDGAVIENNSIAGKAILFALGLAAEIEVNNIRQRTRMGLDARMEEVKRNGFWISNTGNVCTHLGNEPGYDTAAMREAAYESMAAKKSEWAENSAAFKFAKRKFLEGWTARQICDELNVMDADSPGTYRTREGAVITPVTLRKWKMGMGIPLPEKIIQQRDARRRREKYRKRLERYKAKQAMQEAV